MSHVDLNNARYDEQLKRMERHSKEGRCHFCPEGFIEHTSPVIHQSQYWFITGNDFPYQGSDEHYLVVCKRHITKVTETTPEEWSELREMLIWLEDHLCPPGYSVFARSGETCYTAATLDHLHWHFVVGIQKQGPEHPVIFAVLGYQKTTPSGT